jgi:hypothetical protein
VNPCISQNETFLRERVEHRPTTNDPPEQEMYSTTTINHRELIDEE